jgi:ketosteroid isomerase-like protein
MYNRADDGADLTRRTLLAMAAMAPTLAAAGMTSASESAPAAEMPPDLAQAVNDYDQATIRNDTEALGNLVAEDYVLVNSDATVQNKEQYLADFNLPGFRIDPYLMEQPVLKVWGNTALTGGLLHLSWTQDGTHQRRLVRIAHVWARYDGRWWMTYTQVTRFPE